jgi:hypothetical protein
MKVSREEHNKIGRIENHLWEIAKILEPNSYIDPKKFNKSRSTYFQPFITKTHPIWNFK